MRPEIERGRAMYAPITLTSRNSSQAGPRMAIFFDGGRVRCRFSFFTLQKTQKNRSRAIKNVGFDHA
jgi:hypothetical protein